MIIKEQILFEINKILEIIEIFSKLNIKTPNYKISEILDEIQYNINQAIIKIKNELIFLRDKAEWNNYTVGFFGITNAGKSTIIETLINGNGLTIGTGIKDFTKEVLIHDIPNFPKIKIVDMPGIEGDESEFEEIIGKAISQCHTLYAVVGTNKESEEGTILKIKKYLKEQGEIYSIINIRGKADKYARNKSLESENLLKLVERINLQFSPIFNNQYKECLYFNAHLAFCVGAEPKLPSHLNDKQAYLNVFGDFTNAYEFCNFQTLINTIIEGYNVSEQKIAKSNISKISFVIKQIIESLEIQNKEKLEKCLLKDVKKEIELMIVKLNTTVENYKEYIKNTLDNELNSLKNELTSVVYNGIDEGINQSEMEVRIKKITNEFNYKIEKKIKDLVLDLEAQIKKYFNELEARLKLTIDMNYIDININFEKIIEKLSNSLNDIFKKIADFGLRLGSIILAFLANPIAGIITLVVNIIGFFLNLFRDNTAKKQKAKRDAYIHINDLIWTIKTTVDKELISKLNNLSKEINTELNEITITFQKLELLSKQLSESISNIKSVHSQIIKITN